MGNCCESGRVDWDKKPVSKHDEEKDFKNQVTKVQNVKRGQVIR